MSYYKTPSDIAEEAESKASNPYLSGTWAWRQYEASLDAVLRKERVKVMENKYRVSYLSGGVWTPHDSKTLDEAISFAKEAKASVTQITEEEVWSYRLYEELKAKVDSLVEEIGVDTALEILEASNKFKLGD